MSSPSQFVNITYRHTKKCFILQKNIFQKYFRFILFVYIMLRDLTIICSFEYFTDADTKIKPIFLLLFTIFQILPSFFKRNIAFDLNSLIFNTIDFMQCRNLFFFSITSVQLSVITKPFWELHYTTKQLQTIIKCSLIILLYYFKNRDYFISFL